MRYLDYAAFVEGVDQSAGKPEEYRFDIATYGLVAEIGSLLSAVKKAMLAAQDEDDTLVDASRRSELEEELGDTLWYCAALSRLHNDDPDFNLLKQDVRNLTIENSETGHRAEEIERVITSARKSQFIAQASTFVELPDVTLGSYQQLAFLTARTEGRVLERVCLAVLSQLGTEVLRRTLPDVELDLNKRVEDRPLNMVLGEIVWHLAALATLSGLSLDDVAAANIAKLKRRYGAREPTLLFDEASPEHERFPRKFEVAIVTVAPGRSRMYVHGRRLGNDLTDNAAEEDGYRFHDVLHLALVAKLGWSPVIRKLMGRKRKSQPSVDDIQDGARAQIVEELIIKAIHSECAPLFRAREAGAGPSPVANRGLISFGFLSNISRLALGLEAERNQYWEWEEAIFEGAHLFRRLRQSGQGTVTVDLAGRETRFSEDVHVDLPGTVIGVGCAAFTPVQPPQEVGFSFHSASDPAAQAALTEAVLRALRIEAASSDTIREDVSVRSLEGGRLVVKARGRVQEACWTLGALSFRTAWLTVGGVITCTVFALADPQDSMAD